MISNAVVFYYLKDHVACPALTEAEKQLAAEQMIDPCKIVAQDHIGPYFVSTVFLVIDHNIFGDEPLLFETMVFRDNRENFQERCSTWAEAEAMHANAIASVKQLLQ